MPQCQLCDFMSGQSIWGPVCQCAQRELGEVRKLKWKTTMPIVQYHVRPVYLLGTGVSMWMALGVVRKLNCNTTMPIVQVHVWPVWYSTNDIVVHVWTGVCFRKSFFKNKLRAYPHAFLQGIYNSDPKAFFPWDKSKGSQHLVKTSQECETALTSQF